MLNGILNGIDDVVWNPETDTHIVQQFSQHNVVEGKAANKRALQKELGLPERDVRLPSACRRQRSALPLLPSILWCRQSGYFHIFFGPK